MLDCFIYNKGVDEDDDFVNGRTESLMIDSF
jgi:hypothetical protein